MQLKSEIIVGYSVSVEAISELVNWVTQCLRHDARNCRYFACLNPHAAVVAKDDKTFHNSLVCADFLTADGIGIVHASRILGGRLGQRTTGMDVFTAVSREMNRSGKGTCFFLGSTEETLAKIRTKMAETYPKIEVVGTYSPPFKPAFSSEDNDEMIRMINAARPDVLWVGLTAPKQENWIHEHQDRLEVNFAGPIGAAFDFFVGNIKRVSPFWQDLGFEWLPRLLQEPRRLWRRSLVSAPRFFAMVFQYKWSDLRRKKSA